MHLSDAQIVDIAGARQDKQGEEHLRDCARCQARLVDWRSHLEAIRELEAEVVLDREMHRLESIFRCHGPQREGLLSLIASLVRGSGEAALAVRGGESTFLEYEAGSYRLVLHLGSPERAGSIALHGQLLADSDTELVSGPVVLTREDGASYISEMNEWGEFRFSGVRPGMYTGIWTAGQTCEVTIPEIDLNRDPRS